MKNHVKIINLLKWIFCESSPEHKTVMMHTMHCNYCNKRLLILLSLDEEMRVLWRDHNSNGCPDKDVLFTYLEGELNSSQRANVNSHLKDCPHCNYMIEAAQESMKSFDNAAAYA